MSITYPDISVQGDLSGHWRQRIGGQTTGHPVGNAGGALEGASGLAAHCMWPTDLTPFRDLLSVARASYLGGGANQVASFSTLPPASCPASSPTTSLDTSKADPSLARGASSSSPPAPSLVIRSTCHFNPKSPSLFRMVATDLPRDP